MSVEDNIVEPEDYGRYAEGWDEDKWQSQMEEHPLFMTRPAESGELPPLVEAMQQLKFDPELNSNNDLADKYREDGNENFKLKKYKWAIDSYTEGIKLEATDAKLNSILYGNRAASHLRMGNLRSALHDSLKSLQYDKENFKSMKRVAECLYQLDRYSLCIEFCRKHMSKNDSLEDFLIKSMKKQSEALARQQAKKDAQAREAKRKSELLQAIASRGIKLKDPETPFTAPHPAQPLGVQFTENGGLSWPVLFIYPEFGTSDLIQSFAEDDLFIDHLRAVLAEPPEWDPEGRYKADSVRIAHMDEKGFKGGMIFFDPSLSLREVMYRPSFFLDSANPTFCVIHKEWRKKK